MAMSLHVLRPVLRSTRLISRTQRWCVLAYHNRLHKVGEHWTAGCQAVGSSVVTATSLCAPPLCAPRGLSTTSIPETKEGNEKQVNDIMTKLRDAKTPDELLHLVDKCTLNAFEASFAINMLTQHSGGNADGRKEAVKENDPRLMRLNETLMRKVRKLSSRNMVKSLLNCYKLKAKNKEAVVDALVPALRSKLRAMDVFSLSSLVCSHDILSDNRQALDLVYEAARVIELRRREMDDLPPVILNRLLQVTPRFHSNFKVFISDKVLDSLDKFSFSELVQTTSILSQLPLRSIAILRATVYQAIQQSGQWELNSVHRFLTSLASLRFYHQPLAQQMADFVEEKASEWTPANVGAIAKAFMLLRMPQAGLFDAICNFTLNNLTDFSQADLNKLLYAFGDLGYKPKNEKEFYQRVLTKMEPEFVSHTDNVKIQAASALMLSEQLPEFIMKDVLEPKQSNPEPTQLEYNDILLMRINTHARLACPGYKGPYLDCKDVPDGSGQGVLEQSIAECLQRALGKEAFLKMGAWTTLGYKLDGLVLMDENNKPVELDNYQLPDFPMDKTQDKKPLPSGIQRIALLIWTPREMLYDSNELTGRCNMQKKHLQMAGYILIEVTFKQWNEARTEFQRISLMKMKLAEATLGKLKSEVEL